MLHQETSKQEALSGSFGQLKNAPDGLYVGIYLESIDLLLTTLDTQPRKDSGELQAFMVHKG